MNPFVAYFIRSSITLAMFYLFYVLFLRKETFFRFNRFYFLGGMIISLLLPLLDLSVLLPGGTGAPVRVISHSYITLEQAVAVPGTAAVSGSSARSASDILLFIYLAVAGMLLLRLMLQAFLLFIRISRFPVHVVDGVKIVADPHVKSPFSFFTWVFVHPDQLKEPNIGEVILHEKEHIRQHHTWDLLLTELLMVFQWPNPFAWLVNRSVKEIHEYLADKAVLDQGIPAGDYQRTLIGFVLGGRNTALITPLNFSLNHKRILMMKKLRSPNKRKWKGLLLLPVIVFLGFAFSNPGTEKNGDPTFPQPKCKYIITSKQQGNYKVSGKVIDDATGKPVYGVNVVVVNSTHGTVTDPYGKFMLNLQKPEQEVSFSFVGYETVMKKLKADQDVVIRLKRGIIRLDLYQPASEKEKKPHPVTVDDKQEIFFVVEDVPHYPGGMPALKEYISSHLKYSEKLREKGIGGTVWVNFTVDEQGKVKNVYVDKAHSINPQLDKEAVRVISSLPAWTPAKQRGKSVPVELSVPAEFK